MDVLPNAIAGINRLRSGALHEIVPWGGPKRSVPVRKRPEIQKMSRAIIIKPIADPAVSCPNSSGIIEEAQALLGMRQPLE